jgi:hypothetical protein
MIIMDGEVENNLHTILNVVDNGKIWTGLLAWCVMNNSSKLNSQNIFMACRTQKTSKKLQKVELTPEYVELHLHGSFDNSKARILCLDSL